MVIWLIGLSGSGKTTIGKKLYSELKTHHPNLIFVDGDEFREVMGNDLGFSYEDRQKNAYRFSNFCYFLDKQNIHLVCCVLSNFPEWQKWNREKFKQYFEVFVDTSLEKLVERDIKNLYKLAISGKKSNVVGVDIPFVPPENADLILDNNHDFKDISPQVKKILNVLPKLS